ncbi:sigma-70 family RNA polymerase sigma factor [Nannocystis sp. ILAH1]|uniref:RNA polymerase sigma factor n=1 Tax=unclassified Nannocystis TaxID=2627009 RepID=UPI00226ED710|nr:MULTISPECIES: sigma-70 family RNA polymerase sigma factor [unclassified Nannocystis]MCY0990952.1 sigma-70 family RNA polymerase sigma factor [Nannocystis sp. ILAH1]MCY1064454.1 sigma-70 family RNA polymerase sigma factor [Nannocystis sp. RBIL2]
MQDELLLERWREGDRRAGQALVARHYRPLFMFFWGKVGEQASADLTQDTFETLCARQDRFRGESSVRTYLFGIARWKLVEHLRRSRRDRERFDPAQDGVDIEHVERSITSLFALREHEALLIRGLRSLSLDDQLLLELKDYEALTARELAEIFDVPAGTIGGRVSRARERLRLAVKAMSGTPVLADETLHGLDSYFRAIRGTVQDLTKS